MVVKIIKTKPIVLGDNLYKILDKEIKLLKEKSVVVITSKIVAICQGRVVKNNGLISKQELVKKEADYYLADEFINFGIHLSIKNNLLVTSAGIDESNGNGYFILWPENIQSTTNIIWKYLKNKYKLKNIGVIITDSRIISMRKGTSGVGLSWCGFEPLRNYIGAPDIFKRNLHLTKASIVDGLAASAVLNMGEGDEQTPIAIISQIANIKFVDKKPSKKELNEMNINLKDDVYGKILNKAKWIKGEGGLKSNIK